MYAKSEDEKRRRKSGNLGLTQNFTKNTTSPKKR